MDAVLAKPIQARCPASVKRVMCTGPWAAEESMYGKVNAVSSRAGAGQHPRNRVFGPETPFAGIHDIGLDNPAQRFSVDRSAAWRRRPGEERRLL